MVCNALTRSAETSARGLELTKQVSDVEGSYPTSKIGLTVKRATAWGHGALGPSPLNGSGALADFRFSGAPFVMSERADPFTCCDCNDVPLLGGVRTVGRAAGVLPSEPRCANPRRGVMEMLAQKGSELGQRPIPARHVATN